MIHTIPFLILTTTLLLVSCNKKAELAEPPLRPVVTLTVKPATSATTRRFSGQVDSAEGTSIAFEVSGRVLEVSAKAGRKYEAETPLARVDDTDYRNQFSDAQEQFTNAEQELRRMQRLYVSKNVSQSQLEAAIAAILGNKDLPRPPYPTLPNMNAPAPMSAKLAAVQAYIEKLADNCTGVDYFDVRKHRPMSRILETGREVTRQALPIKCVEAVFVGAYLTPARSRRAAATASQLPALLTLGVHRNIARANLRSPSKSAPTRRRRPRGRGRSRRARKGKTEVIPVFENWASSSQVMI